MAHCDYMNQYKPLNFTYKSRLPTCKSRKSDSFSPLMSSSIESKNTLCNRSRENIIKKTEMSLDFSNFSENDHDIFCSLFDRITNCSDEKDKNIHVLIIAPNESSSYCFISLRQLFEVIENSSSNGRILADEVSQLNGINLLCTITIELQLKVYLNKV